MRTGVPVPNESAPLSLSQVRGDAHAQGVQPDESRGVGLVVGPAVVLEGRDRGVEERVGPRRPADGRDRALVQLDAYRAVDVLLRLVDQSLQQRALGTVPV